MIDYNAIEKNIQRVVEIYEKTAPTVADWADDLYRRINSAADKVVWSEISLIQNLLDPEPMHPNYAANRVYHLLTRLGRDTTGQAGY